MKKSSQELSTLAGRVKDLEGYNSFAYAKRNPCSVLNRLCFVFCILYAKMMWKTMQVESGLLTAPAAVAALPGLWWSGCKAR